MSTLQIKFCSICEVTKPVTEFHRRGGTYKSGCKPCRNAINRAWKADNIEAVRETSKLYRPASNPSKCLERRANYPKAVRATDKVRYAVKTGKLKKLDCCEQCNAGGRIVAHHPEYNKPLDVEWLCSVCHSEWHTLNGPGLNKEGA